MNAPPKMDVHEHTEHSVRISLGESDIRLKPDYRRTGELRPTSISFAWRWNDEAGEWALSTATVSGPIVKKDGSDGQNFGKTGYNDGFRGKLKDDIPQWVLDLLDAHTPTTIGTGR